MIDFHGYLVDPGEVICVTPVHESSITDQFFIVNFRGGSNQSFPGEYRDEFVALVKIVYYARQIPDDDLA